MTKQEMKRIVNECMSKRSLCRTYFHYDPAYWYFFPLLADDKLFLSMEEDDFILDGYSIRRFRDMTKAEIKADKCADIFIKEAVIDSIVVPDVDISTWDRAFSSLQSIGKNVIVESEDIDREESWFIIGRIEKVYKSCCYVRHFDADGIWQDEPNRIEYGEITSVTFDSRYVNVFSKYVDPDYSV